MAERPLRIGASYAHLPDAAERMAIGDRRCSQGQLPQLSAAELRRRAPFAAIFG